MVDKLELHDLFPEWKQDFLRDVQNALDRIIAIEDELKAKYPDFKGFVLNGVDVTPMLN